VRKVSKATCYYECLGIQRTATVDEIRKSYRQLARLLHPDKCTVNGSEAAFKVAYAQVG
jgi:DnaJ homolog subfamily B member 12